MRHSTNYSLLKHTTFGIEAKAQDFYEYDSKEELRSLYQKGVFQSEWLAIGGGSNLLLMNDLSYPVVHSKIRGVEVLQQTDQLVKVQVGAGCVWDDFVNYTVFSHWGGVENLSYIPGSVGASPVQNVGAYGVEAKDVIDRVEVYDTKKDEFIWLTNEECQFGYRDSLFKKEKQFIVVNVVFNLVPEECYQLQLEYGNVKSVLDERADYSLQGVRQAIIDIRRAKLPEPYLLGSAGSFFKNPVVSVDRFNAIASQYEGMPFYEVGDSYKIPAAWLIAQCGWKGKSLGAAGVYEKQPLILVNRGGATGADIVALMEQIQESVRSQFSIELHPEVCLIK